MSISVMSNIRQYLSFTLGEELFALHIAGVREVLDYIKITRVPLMPRFMLGVINLRGSVVPVINMRMKFGLPEGEKTVNTCIIIVDATFNGETIVLGMLVDRVNEVFDMEQEEIEDLPEIGSELKRDFIKGMGKKGENFVIILDVDRIFSFEELSVLQNREENY